MPELSQELHVANAGPTHLLISALDRRISHEVLLMIFVCSAVEIDKERIAQPRVHRKADDDEEVEELCFRLWIRDHIRCHCQEAHHRQRSAHFEI